MINIVFNALREPDLMINREQTHINYATITTIQFLLIDWLVVSVTSINNTCVLNTATLSKQLLLALLSELLNSSNLTDSILISPCYVNRIAIG